MKLKLAIALLGLLLGIAKTSHAGGGGSDRPDLYCESKTLGYSININDIKIEPIRVGSRVAMFLPNKEYRHSQVTRLEDSLLVIQSTTCFNLPTSIQIEISFDVSGIHAEQMKVQDDSGVRVTNDVHCYVL